MHINEAKQLLLAKLKELGYKASGPNGSNPDFKVLLAPAMYSFLIILLSKKLKDKSANFFPDLIKEIGLDCTINRQFDKLTFTNEQWELPLRENASTHSAENQTNANVVQLGNEKTVRKKYTRKGSATKSSESLGSSHLVPVINEELVNLRKIVEQFEDIVDNFKLAKLSVREIAGHIYDGLKQDGIGLYSTNVEIKFNGGSLVIPSITKEAFIAIVVKIITPQRVPSYSDKAVAN